METINPESERILKGLTETSWRGKINMLLIKDWVKNFSDDSFDDIQKQQEHAAYLLTKFMFFGHIEIRELLKAIYRDLFKYTVVESIRRKNNNTLDISIINSTFDEELKATRFLGLGNPSESGSHLLYYFRQENNIKKELFINSYQVFNRFAKTGAVDLAEPAIKRYVLLDDFCGSGTQAKDYSDKILEDLYKLNPEAETFLFVLLASENALEEIRNTTKFTKVAAVMEFDSSFQCFSEGSRFFLSSPPDIDKIFAKRMAEFYGQKLIPACPLGYKDGQLLFGFFHNTPDNTLPIFSYDWPDSNNWMPIFKRYPKIEEYK